MISHKNLTYFFNNAKKAKLNAKKELGVGEKVSIVAKTTVYDIGIFLGTIGFFFVLFLLYSRTFPVIAQAEVKTILKTSGDNYKKIRDKNG